MTEFVQEEAHVPHASEESFSVAHVGKWMLAVLTIVVAGIVAGWFTGQSHNANDNSKDIAVLRQRIDDFERRMGAFEVTLEHVDDRTRTTDQHVNTLLEFAQQKNGGKQ